MPRTGSLALLWLALAALLASCSGQSSSDSAAGDRANGPSWGVVPHDTDASQSTTDGAPTTSDDDRLSSNPTDSAQTSTPPRTPDQPNQGPSDETADPGQPQTTPDPSDADPSDADSGEATTASDPCPSWYRYIADDDFDSLDTVAAVLDRDGHDQDAETAADLAAERGDVSRVRIDELRDRLLGTYDCDPARS